MVHYPNRLLPQPHYKKIPIHHPDVRFLTRFTPNKDFWDPDTDTVKVKSFCSPKENLFDYSTSLLGVFQPEDNYIKMVGDNFDYFTKYDWLEGEAVPEPVFEKDFTIEDERGLFFLDIDHLLNHWKSLPYEKDGETYFVAPIVIHTPKNANFWHVSVQWTDENGEVFIKEKKKWKGKMINKIREYFKEFAFWETPGFEEIPETVYIKTED